MSGLDETIDQEDIQQEVMEDVEQKQEKPVDDVKFFTKEQWLEMGRDPKDWRDPVEFKHKGELIRQKKELKEYFEAKLNNELKTNNMMWEFRLKQEREELLAMRDDAIDIADKAQVKSIDAKLEANRLQTEMVSAQTAPQSQKPKEIEEWESDNPWIFNQDDPRVKIANGIVEATLAQGKTIAAALRAVDREMAKLEVPKRSSGQLVEGSRVASSKREPMGLTWEDLTPQEIRAFESGMFGDKKTFLKTVQNTRVK